MRRSEDQNSALILSLWNCKFAWFFADSTNKDAESLSRTPKTQKALELIYERMRPLRLTIHDHHMNDIPEIARLFNSIVLESKIPHEVWTGELHSLMEEVVSINHVLKDYQHRLLVDTSDTTKSTSTLRDSFDHIHQQPKFTVCLLTLWYWLVVWCFPDVDKPSSNHSINDDAKKNFIFTIESHCDMLARCLVNSSTNINTEQPHLQSLFTMLIEMLKLDLQHWIDALDYFTGKMVNAGLLRGQVNKVLNASSAFKDDCSMPKLFTKETPEKGLVMSAPKFLSKKGGLTNLIRDAIIQKVASEVVDNLEHLVVNVFHGLKGAADYIVEETPEVLREVGHEVVVVAKQIGNGVEHFVHNQVSHLGHMIGAGMHNFAKGVHSVANKVGHFFSSLF